MTPVRILIADDHKILRDGLEVLLQKEPGFDVVGTAGDGREAVKLTADLQPDVLILDIGMPEMNGIDAAQKINEDFPSVRMIGLSVHTDPLYVERMFQNGAVGYLPKDCAAEELTRAIRTVMAGQVYVSPGVTGAIVDDYVRQLSAAADEPATLSHREREVLQLLAEGASTANIAAELHLSVKTIETHRKRIMDKLSLRSIAELTKYAIREGITTLDC